MQPEFHSGAVTRPLSAYLRLAMMGCPALRARGELAAGAATGARSGVTAGPNAPQTKATKNFAALRAVGRR